MKSKYSKLKLNTQIAEIFKALTNQTLTTNPNGKNNKIPTLSNRMKSHNAKYPTLNPLAKNIPTKSTKASSTAIQKKKIKFIVRSSVESLLLDFLVDLYCILLQGKRERDTNRRKRTRACQMFTTSLIYSAMFIGGIIYSSQQHF